MFKALWNFIRQGREDANSIEDSLQRRKVGVDYKMTVRQDVTKRAEVKRGLKHFHEIIFN